MMSMNMLRALGVSVMMVHRLVGVIAMRMLSGLFAHAFTYLWAWWGSSSLRKHWPAVSNNITVPIRLKPGKNANHHMPAER